MSAFNFRYVGRRGGEFVFRADLAHAKPALAAQRFEADVARWMLDDSSGEGVRCLAPEAPGTLLIGMQRLADIAAFEDRFGKTGIRLDQMERGAQALPVAA